MPANEPWTPNLSRHIRPSPFDQTTKLFDFRFVISDPDQPERRSPARHPWKRIENRKVIVFLTVCTKNRRALLADPQIHQMLISHWIRADTWDVGRYVILPDHLHLFASPKTPESPAIRKWMTYWKSSASREWPGRKDGPVWQRDCWDRQLRSGESYSKKWEYVRMNPVRHGLVNQPEDWPYQGELNEFVWHD